MEKEKRKKNANDKRNLEGKLMDIKSDFSLSSFIHPSSNILLSKRLEILQDISEQPPVLTGECVQGSQIKKNKLKPTP